VDTEDEEKKAIIRYAVHRYDGSYKWTDWPHDHDPNDLSPMDAVTDELRAWWDERTERKRAAQEKVVNTCEHTLELNQAKEPRVAKQRKRG